MPMEYRNLAEEFEVLADDRQAPVSAVDYGRAMARGRRTLRLRRSAGGLTAVVTLVLAAMLTGMPRLPGTGGEPAGASPPGIDPLIVQVEFGWVPSNLTMVSYDSTTGDTSVQAAAPEPANGSDQSAVADGDLQSAFIYLTVYTNLSAGRPDMQGPTTQVGTLNGYPVQFSSQPAGLTDSRGNVETVDPVTCKAEPSHPMPTLAQHGIYAEGDAGLLWHTATGQVATLDYHYVNQAIPDSATLMHIAETATFESKPIPLPFSVTGVTRAQILAVSQATDLSRIPAQNSLTYTVGDTAVSIIADPPASVTPSTCPNTSDGTKADEVINGLHLYVTETSMKGPDTAVDMSKTGTPQAILKRITSYGPNPAKWTVNVLAR